MRLLLLFLAAAAVAASPAAAQTCGNAVREVPEQCDDGNHRNLDGCDASCRFELVHRITSARLEGLPAPICPANAFGGAFSEFALGQTQVAIDTSIGVGATSILFHAAGLDDLAGVSDPALEIGITSGAPVTPGSIPYNGTNDRDWWYGADPAFLDPQRVPLDRLPATISGNVLTAGPGTAQLKFVLTGPTRVFRLSSLVVSATASGLSAPSVSSGRPPGHLAHEHLDPTLQSFDTLGVDGTEPGTICGDISAESLAQAPVPLIIQLGQPGACSPGYTAANSLLDVLVAGCELGGFPIVQPTQPDASDPAVPDLGNGPPYTFLANPVTHRVNGCRDAADLPVPLADCLRDAAYSSYFTFTSGRVIAGDDLIHRDSFESGNFVQWSAVSTDGGDLVVSPSGALAGTSQGLVGTIDDTAGLFVEDQRPEDENRYRARFYFDPSGFDPGEAVGARRTRIFVAFEDSPLRRLAAVVLKRQNGAYSVMGRVRQDDNSQRDTGFFPVAAGPHLVEIDWIRASGPDANDGRFTLSIDGAVVSSLTDVDNSISSVDFARLGALSVKVGASGTLKWDHFESRRLSGIGP